MKQFNFISKIYLTVLSVVFSSVVYANSTAEIHSSSSVVGGETLNIYDIEFTIHFKNDTKNLYNGVGSGYPFVYGEIKLENVNNGQGGNCGGYNHCGALLWDEPQGSPKQNAETLTVSISSLFVKNVADPSIQLQGQLYHTSRIASGNRLLCHFKPMILIKKSDVGKTISDATSSSDECKLVLDKFTAFINN